MGTLRTTVMCCCLLLARPGEAAAEAGAGVPAFSASLHAGSFSGNSNPQFTGPSDGIALALALNVRVGEHVAIGLDLTGYDQQYDSGMSSSDWFVAVDDEMDVSTSAMSVQVLYVATAPRAGFYAGGGLGYYKTTATVGTAAFGIFPGGDVLDESDSSVGMHGVAGIGLGLGETVWLDLQYRKVSAEASLGGALGTVDVGGDLLMLGAQWRFE